MQNYRLTKEAEDDLIGIWSYTADNCGEAQADYYLHLLEACFQKITKGKNPRKQPLINYPALFACAANITMYFSWREKRR